MDATPTIFDKANLLAPGFAARAAQHDRDASFPFENFRELGDAGLLVERLGSLPDGRAIEFSQSYYRGDTYDFVAELST